MPWKVPKRFINDCEETKNRVSSESVEANEDSGMGGDDDEHIIIPLLVGTLDVMIFSQHSD